MWLYYNDDGSYPNGAIIIFTLREHDRSVTGWYLDERISHPVVLGAEILDSGFLGFLDSGSVEPKNTIRYIVDIFS